MTYETQTPFVLNLHKASVQRREAPGSVESNNDDRLFQGMGSRAEGGKPRQCSGSAWRTAPLVVIIVLMFRLFLHLSLKCLYFSHAALKDQEPKVYKFKEVNSSRLQASSKSTPGL